MKPVTEFKFACPVCHQHIMADIANAGSEIECPTCYQHIIVPKSPSGATTKLILRGTQVNSAHPATRFHGASSGTTERVAVSLHNPLVAVAVVSLIVVVMFAWSHIRHF